MVAVGAGEHALPQLLGRQVGNHPEFAVVVEQQLGQPPLDPIVDTVSRMAAQRLFQLSPPAIAMGGDQQACSVCRKEA